MGTTRGFKKELDRGANAMGISLDEGTLEQFALFFSELTRFNERINLVSRKKKDWIRVHFLDSLAPAALGLVPGGGRLLDLGAGAGFPGIPLKLACPGLQLGLAEASGKKCAWLRHLVRILNLEGTAVLEGRFEDLPAREGGESWDLVVTRAAAKPTSVVPVAMPFLKPGGRVLVFTRGGLVEAGKGTLYPYSIPGMSTLSAIWEISK